MKTKSILIGVLLLQTGCISGYKAQVIKVPRHTVKIYNSKIEMQNSYARYTVNRKDPINREYVEGFFSSTNNTLHCYMPFPEECLLHEYKHFLTKYGFTVPDDPHFKSRPAKPTTELTLTGH